MKVDKPENPGGDGGGIGGDVGDWGWRRSSIACKLRLDINKI